jgi:preprotein translocase SecE subunit
MQFIKDSFRELKHVVWPTREETKLYFWQVFWSLFFFTLFLYILSKIFSYTILFLKASI